MLLLVAIVFYKKFILSVACIYGCYLILTLNPFQPLPFYGIKAAEWHTRKLAATIISFTVLLIPAYLIVLVFLPLYVGNLFKYVVCAMTAKLFYKTKTLYQYTELQESCIDQLDLQLKNIHHKLPTLKLTSLLKLITLDARIYGPILSILYVRFKKQKQGYSKTLQAYGKACLCVVLTGYPLWCLAFLKKTSTDIADCIDMCPLYKKKN